MAVSKLALLDETALSQSTKSTVAMSRQATDESALARQITWDPVMRPADRLPRQNTAESPRFGRQVSSQSCQSLRALARQASPDSETQADYGWTVTFYFGSIGLATSIVWNQLMLCVGILVELFGDTALSSASLSQSILCAATMFVITVLPTGESTRLRIVFSLTAMLAMIVLANAFAFAFYKSSFPQWTFLVAVALNGIFTGTTQSLAASLAGLYEGAPKALLLGESLSPLVAVATSVVVGALPLSSDSAGAVCMLISQVFLLLAVASLLKLMSLKPKVLGYPDTFGRCISSGGLAQEYAYQRVSELVGNAGVAVVSCAIWLLLLCSAPFIADGLCGSSSGSCKSSLPATMISVANVAAVCGRFGAYRLTGAKLRCLLVDSLLLCISGVAVIVACVKGLLESTFPHLSPIVVAAALAGGLTLWCNLLLMRNDHNAQLSCTHSILAPCPVTTQVMWLAIQTGSIVGTVVANQW